MINIANLHTTNKIQEKLDARITEAIKQTAKEHKITPAEIAGVMRAIEIRLFIRSGVEA